MILPKWMALVSTLTGALCLVQDVEPAKKFIEQMDKAPADQRVPNWEQTKSLMARVAPKVGGDAPDFSLPSLDGNQTVKLTQHKGDKPVVLIFGSFT